MCFKLTERWQLKIKLKDESINRESKAFWFLVLRNECCDTKSEELSITFFIFTSERR